MSVSGIGSTAAHAFKAGSKDTKADETLQQLADQGDPIAIAELKAQQQGDTPKAGHKTGAHEPGKGEAVDEYI